MLTPELDVGLFFERQGTSEGCILLLSQLIYRRHPLEMGSFPANIGISSRLASRINTIGTWYVNTRLPSSRRKLNWLVVTHGGLRSLISLVLVANPRVFRA